MVCENCLRTHERKHNARWLWARALLDLSAQLKLTDVLDRVRSITEALYQELIDAEAASVIGARKYERSEDCTTRRNGSRPRTLSTTAGDLELRIPKLRRGSFF